MKVYMKKAVEIEPGFFDLDKATAPPEESMSPQEILDLKHKDDMSFQAYYDDNDIFIGYSLVK